MTQTRMLGAGSIRNYSLLLLVLLLAGCDRDSFMKPFGYDRAGLMKGMTPRDDESLALRSVELLRQRRFEQVEDHLDPSIKDAETSNMLAGIAELFPNREPASIKTVDAKFMCGGDSCTTSITLEYEFAPDTIMKGGKHDQMPRSWLLAQAVIQERDGVRTIGGLHVMPISAPVEVTNEFSLFHKGISQYVGLSLAILVSVFGLYAIAVCIRTKKGKAKWVWLILMLLGVCRFSVNWTTGQWFLTVLTVQLPPVMTFCTPYGPWLVQVTAPVGAIAFLLLRK